MVARDPLAAVVRNDLAVFLLADGQLEEALSQFRSVQAIHPDTDPNVAIDIVHVLILQGRYDEGTGGDGIGCRRAVSATRAGPCSTRPPGTRKKPTPRLKRMSTESEDPWIRCGWRRSMHSGT